VGDQPKVRILVADPQALFRDAISTALGAEEDLRVVSLLEDPFEAARRIERGGIDVALVERSLLSFDETRFPVGYEMQNRGCRLIVLAEPHDENALDLAVDLGASGFLTKDAPLSDLFGAIRSVNGGETVIPPRQLGGVLRRLQRRRPSDHYGQGTTRLTRRERQVLALLGQGADDRAIAQKLVISPQTARTHIQHALPKLGVHSRREAAALVARGELIEEL
jgi:DNA-binding NarL/FixJ family response regulator